MDPINSSPKNIPTVFIVYGATGDLMAKKIVPALFTLYKKGKFPKLFKVIGFSRRDLTDEQFASFVREVLGRYSKNAVDKEDLEKFLSYFLFHRGNFDTIASYKSLAARLGIIDGGWNVCSNKLFYLAVPPTYFKDISERLASSGLTIPCGAEEGWTRVIVEKPFGRDSKSAEDLDTLLAKLFKEEQIYRIDHYLAKEMLQNILTFRFANNLFEDEWNNLFIDRINIRTLEEIGVEGRGPFYDGIGALRDVGQNHLLQMLALITMDRPESFNSESVREKRAEILSTLEVLKSDKIKKKTFRGQYAGYREIAGVTAHSQTETYFRVFARLNSSKWTGVKIMLEAGKKLYKKKEIEIILKHPNPCFCPPGKPHFQNKITIGLEPKEGITIEFWSKKPGLDYSFSKRKFNFVLRNVNKRVQYVEEYEKLLLDCISGNQILFLSTPEIRACWKYIDPIVAAWKKNEVPLVTYKPASKEITRQADTATETIASVLKKEVGIIGLGKMGANVAKRLNRKGWKVVAFNRTETVTQGLEKEGIVGAYSVDELVSKLSGPRVILSMLPTGIPTDDMFFGAGQLGKKMHKGDILIDGANSFYKDTKKRNLKLKKLGIRFIDAGISGGPSGALNGACLMVGGERYLFKTLLPLFIDMAKPGAVMHFEGIGAGHFVKMVHNGIEYGMMQAIAEGFSIMKDSKYNLDLSKVTKVYNNGSVVESRLIGWLEQAFKKYGNDLGVLSGAVGFNGEGEWTALTAKEMGIPAPVIEDSVEFRKRSQKAPSYSGKVLTGLRNGFGGHSIEKGKMT